MPAIQKPIKMPSFTSPAQPVDHPRCDDMLRCVKCRESSPRSPRVDHHAAHADPEVRVDYVVKDRLRFDPLEGPKLPKLAKPDAAASYGWIVSKFLFLFSWYFPFLLFCFFPLSLFFFAHFYFYLFFLVGFIKFSSFTRAPGRATSKPKKRKPRIVPHRAPLGKCGWLICRFPQ